MIGASTLELTGDGDANVAAVALVGLDASGRTTWSKRHAPAGPGGAPAASFAALQLTTDGGALVTALSGDATTGAAWTMKALAKDGSLGAAPVVTSSLTLDDGPPCEVRRASFAPTISDIEIVAETRGVKMEKR